MDERALIGNSLYDDLMPQYECIFHHHKLEMVPNSCSPNVSGSGTLNESCAEFHCVNNCVSAKDMYYVYSNRWSIDPVKYVGTSVQCDSNCSMLRIKDYVKAVTGWSMTADCFRSITKVQIRLYIAYCTFEFPQNLVRMSRAVHRLTG